MAKGGKQKGENEYTRQAKQQPKGTDICKFLAALYAAAPDAETKLKIKFAQKIMGCRGSSGGGP